MKNLFWIIVLGSLLPGCIEDRTPGSEAEDAIVQQADAGMDMAPADIDADSAPEDGGPITDATSTMDAMPVVDSALPVEHACPIPRVFQTDFEVVPLDVVALDARPSVVDEGPNSHPLRYEWVVTERPRGSTSTPLELLSDPAQPANGGPRDEVDTPNAWFFVDSYGTYVLELRVSGGGGPSEVCPDPEPVIVRLTTPPEPRAIEIEMTWNNPEVVDPAEGEANDVDLHFRHPLGQEWGQGGGPYDCYFANASPDWGQLDIPDDDPSLDQDAQQERRENVTLSNPENTARLGAPYLIGAHYYNSQSRVTGHEFGPTEVTIRVRSFGVLLHESTRRLEREGLLWEAAEIHVDGDAFRVVGLDRVVEHR